ncbi:MAG: mechanosensitive ion channel [Deltaproteobacteria bacterium]|nr:mechanosensitive ion channel [Deltaproteobacteria bacterium]MBN2672364.1 mechanosensitive ion channel [Deltaproteobacteria bacterium]
MWNKILTSIENSGAMVFSVIIVAVVSFILYRLAKRALNILETKDKLAAPVVSTLKVLTRWIFFFVTLLLILQTIGVLQNVWAALLAIAAAVAVGFVAEWSILSNIFSTLLVLIYRPYRIGDTVELPTAKVKGMVVDINFLYTTFKIEDNLQVQVPNKTFFFQPIIRAQGDETVSLYEQLKSDKPAER